MGLLQSRRILPADRGEEMLSFKRFLKYIESQNGIPETDEEAKVRLSSDVRQQSMYDQLRQAGKSPGAAWNAVIQHNWSMKKAASSVTPSSPTSHFSPVQNTSPLG